MKNKVNGANTMARLGKTNQTKTGAPEPDNTNLYIKGLWKDCTQLELDDLFKPYGIIRQSRVYGDGVGFVRYETSQQALLAIQLLNGTKPNPKCGQTLIVKCAHKKTKQPKSLIKVGSQQIEMTVHENTKNIYIRGLPHYFNESDMYQLCSPYGHITCIRLCKNGFAFVRFLTGTDAKNAIQNLHGKLLPNSNQSLLVKLANSDPFEPRIEFHNHNGVNYNGNENLSIPDVNEVNSSHIKGSSEIDNFLTTPMKKLSLNSSKIDNMMSNEKSTILHSTSFCPEEDYNEEDGIVEVLPIDEDQTNEFCSMEQPVKPEKNNTGIKLYTTPTAKFVNKKNFRNPEEESISAHENDTSSPVTNSNSLSERPQLSYSFGAQSNESSFTSFSANNYLINNQSFGSLLPSLNNFSSFASLASVDGMFIPQHFSTNTPSSNDPTKIIGYDFNNNVNSPNFPANGINPMFWNPNISFNFYNNQIASSIAPVCNPNQMYNYPYGYNSHNNKLYMNNGTSCQ